MLCPHPGQCNVQPLGSVAILHPPWGPTAPRPTPPLLGPLCEHLGGVESLVVLVRDDPPDHLQDFFGRFTDEGVVDWCPVAQQEGSHLGAEALISDYRLGGG